MIGGGRFHDDGLRAVHSGDQEQVIDPFDGAVGGIGAAAVLAALQPGIAQAGLDQSGMDGALRLGVEIAAGEMGSVDGREKTLDLLQAIRLFARGVEMGVDHAQTCCRHGESDARLDRPAGPRLRRVDPQRHDQVVENWPAREHGDPVLPTLIVERLAEYAMEIRQTGQHRELVDAAGPPRPAIDFLQQHQVGLC